MSSSARIDELRKKFDENPRRFFAPLANEYRKAGDFEQAVFICQEYLPQQPGHMSGHIVYGQTLFDMGRDEEARAVFETALTLDPENLIALKHLGDIARQAGDLEGSRSWYQRVLEADPRNDEIVQILEAMGGVAGERGMSPQRASASDFESVAPSYTDAGAHETPLEPAAEIAGPVGEEAEPFFPSTAESAGHDIEPLVLEQSIDAELPVAEPEVMAGLEAAAAPDAEADSDERTHELLDLDDFSIGNSDVPSDVPAVAEQEPIEAAASLDFAAFGDEPLSAEAAADEPASEAPPEPAVELATDIILGLPDDTPEPPPLPTEEALAELQVEPATAAGEDLARAIDQLEGLESFSMDVATEPPPVPSDEGEVPAAPAPDTFATETMAELYAQQGHLDSAMEIYGQLLERSPDDTELRRRAEEVERQLHRGPARASLESAGDVVASGAAETAAAETSDATPEAMAGPTIREFFQEILQERHAGEIAATGESPGAVDLPEDDALIAETEGSIDMLFSDSPTADDDLSAAMSLAEAFGGDDEGEDTALRGTPAHPAADELSLDHVFRTATPAKGNAAAGAFSLDQFFSGDAANPERSETSPDANSPRSSDDIAQFNAWLNGLKKS